MKKILLAFAAIAVLVSCQKKDEMKPCVGDSSRPVTFSVENIYSLATKADPIGNGTKVGIFAGDPINRENVQFNVTMTSASAGTLAPVVTNSLLWGVGQTTKATNFLAVYPWASGLSLVGVTEDVKSFSYEISDAENVDYADKFLTAAASQAPGTGETPAKVALAFRHPFAKLVYNIDNQSDDYIADVKISGIRRNGKIMFISGAAVPTGAVLDAENAISLNVVTPNASYMTVVMPESTPVEPAITITMVSGAKYSYALTSSTTLLAGKVYTASITIAGTHGTEESNRTLTGTFTVADWENVNAGALTGGISSEAGKWWYLEGNIDEIGGTEDGNWNKHIPFKCVGPTTWQVDFYYAGTDDNQTNGFKIRYAADASDWEEAYGMSEGNVWVIDVETVKAEGAEGDPYLVHSLTTEGGTNIAMTGHGNFRIKFFTDTHNFNIYKLD